VIARRVIMLSRDQGLASIAGQLVGRGQPLTRFSSPADVPDWLRPPTGVVVLDYPKTTRAVVYRQLRQRYQGPVLALLDPDEDASGLPTDHGRIGTLHRPFTGEELSASLDALAGSRNGARRSKSRSLTAPPLGDDADTTAPLDVSAVFAATPARLRARREASGAAAAVPPAIAWVPLATPRVGAGGAAAGAGAAQDVVGVPAARVAVRRVAAARRRRGLWSRHMGPAARRRVNSLVLILAATAALIAGITLSDGGGCRSTGCRNVAGAAESGGAGIPPSTTIPATPQPGDQPGAGSGKGGATKGSGVAAAAPPGPSMVIPIASGVGDLISGTSSSSGGAPLLVVAPGSTGGTGSTGGGTGGGTPTPTTQPTATTSPVTTVPPPTTTAPPATTSPPPTTQPPTTTEPPTTTQPPTTTEPPTTTSEPPTTQAPTTTEPATTAPATTAAATTDTTASSSSPTAN